MPASFNDPVTGDLACDILEVMKEFRPDLLDQKSLDHGFVRVLDVMPRLVPSGARNCDFAIADAARISYQKGTRKVSSDAGLVDHLVRNRHTSPVEMAVVKFHLRMPIFTMRQLIRHRTASVNEESARYSELASDFYVPKPEHWAVNTAANKQATLQGGITPEQATILHRVLTMHNSASYGLYQQLLEGKDFDDFDTGEITKVTGIAREQARMVLGVNVYTQCIWRQDLKNLLHLLSLRCDEHAQFEIRELANPMREVVKFLFPATWASFEDHFVSGVNFGASELQLVQCLTKVYPFGEAWPARVHDAARIVADLEWTVRRLEEFAKKLKRSHLVHTETIDEVIVAYKTLKGT